MSPRGEPAGWFARRWLTADLSISHTGDTAGAVVVLTALPDTAYASDQDHDRYESEGRGGHTMNPTRTADQIRDADAVKDDVTEISLRPNDFDVAGHLDNSVYPELLETARWRWGRANGLDVRETTPIAVVLTLHPDYLRALADLAAIAERGR